MKLNCIKLLLVVAFTFSSRADCMQEFFDHVRDNIYPGSSVLDAQCQICHQTAFGAGAKDRWNAFGWEVRQGYLASGAVTSLLRLEEGLAIAGILDPDGDGVRSVVEIEFGFQPGWNNNVNTIFPKSGAPFSGNPIPALSMSVQSELPPALIDPISEKITKGEFIVKLETIASEFSIPVYATTTPSLDDSLFVVEKTGKIIQLNLTTGVKTTFLDVSTSLFNPSQGEHGLLGLAFHPNYASNGRFYTYQSEPVAGAADFSTLAGGTANHQSVIVEWTVSNPLGDALVSSSVDLLRIDQPSSNHNGGTLAFSPGDGYLYISLGDGGYRDDYGAGHGDFGNGRDNTNVLGSLLRIDVEGSNSTNGKYGVPATNPFIGMEGVDEIFAYGFRNPYRFSFDQNGDLYVGDVGQNNIEEINKVSIAKNYGWNWKEGNFYFFPLSDNPFANGLSSYISSIEPPGVPQDLEAPLAEYDHDEGNSVTGGRVYRGNSVPGLNGHYVFADFSGRLFYLDDSDQIKEFQIENQIGFSITGFGEDANHELYVIGDTFSGNSGSVKRVTLGMLDDAICIPIKTSNGNVAVVCL